ncbi:MAG: DinB family protein [Gemmatimonadota bacterium]|nr:DinB family protein [Gemmatimonadota bacterium]
MHPQLQAIEQELARARSRFARLMAATSDAKWATRSAPDQWSVAECIAHLNLSSRAMQPLLEHAVSEARALGRNGAGRFHPTMLGRMLAAMLGPAPGIGKVRLGRTRTPSSFEPSGDLARAVVVAEFERHLEAHARTLAAADGLPIDRVRVESPFAKGVSYDAYSAFRIVARHMHRHLAQAERV